MKTLFLLNSDILIWLLFGSIAFILIRSYRKQGNRRSWKIVFKNKRTIVATVILSVFMGIALLDSIHFKNDSGSSQQIQSVLDLLLEPYSSTMERSYSAPLASHLFDHKVNGEHPKLEYYHLMGTSKIGEDVFYQSLKSIRTGFIIGSLTTLFMLPFAVLFGIMAGYFGGWIDDVIQYIYTTLSSIPGVLLIAAAVLTLQAIMNRHENWFQTIDDRSDARLLALCAILGVTSWTTLCRLLRGEVLKLREIEFIQAAKGLGVGHTHIMFKHLLPQLIPIILISVTLDFSGLVLAEAVLSYVGVGVDPASYSWGTMINNARLEMARVPIVWWSLSAAFVFMFTLVLCANIFADALRDALDPRMQY